MNLSTRDKRALMLLGAAVVLVLLFMRFSAPSTGSGSAPSTNNVALAEMRLRKLRTIAATLPAKQRIADQARAALELREQTLINANDEKLAQERLLDIVQKLGQSQAPPLAIKSVELGQPKPFGDYGEVLVTLTMACRVEQLVNFLSDLTAQPEAVATEELHVFSANPETKEMQIRLTIGGLIPGRLLPRKKELAAF